jgi:hypothetical protein
MCDADVVEGCGHESTGRLTCVYGLLPDVSKELNDRRIDQDRMQSYIRPVVKQASLLAIMGIRAPRANR